MPEKHPQEDEPIEAQLADEQPHEHPAGPEAAQGPAADYYRREKKRKGSGLGATLLLLLVFAVVAVILRKEITGLYDGLVVPERKPAAAPVVNPAPEARPVPRPAPAPKVEEPPAETPAPVFEPRTEEKAPPAEVPSLPPVMMKEHKPGLMYAVLDRQDVSVQGASMFVVKVLVPRNYTKPDLLRMARDIVENETKVGVPHAIRFLCFLDRQQTNEPDAFAEVVWAPDGNFAHAIDAVKTGGVENQYRVVSMKPLNP